MKQIYLNREQCELFDVPYYEAGSTSLPADEILRSRFMGYDKEHQAFLESMGRHTIHLRKLVTDAPGWYTVENR